MNLSECALDPDLDSTDRGPDSVVSDVSPLFQWLLTNLVAVPRYNLFTNSDGSAL
jgi:hypothetical protein